MKQESLVTKIKNVIVVIQENGEELDIIDRHNEIDLWNIKLLESEINKRITVCNKATPISYYRAWDN